MYTFPFLSIRLCKAIHIAIITKVDNEVKSAKMHSFDRARSEGRTILSLGKRASLGVETLTKEGTYRTADASGFAPGI